MKKNVCLSFKKPLRSDYRAPTKHTHKKKSNSILMTCLQPIDLNVQVVKLPIPQVSNSDCPSQEMWLPTQ